MILFTILLLTLIILTVITVALASVAGAGIVIIFGDVIVCAVFIAIIMRYLVKRKKK